MAKNSRDRDIVALLGELKFMRTDQIHRALFTGRTMEDCRKTLRRLEKAGVIGHVRPRTFRRKGEHEGHWAYWHLSPEYAKVLGQRMEVSEAAHLEHWEQVANLYLALREVPGLVLEDFKTQVYLADDLIADAVVRATVCGDTWVVYSEVDRGTESLFQLGRKLARYSAVMGWGRDARAVDGRCLLVLVKGPGRAASIARLVRTRHKRVPDSLAFVVLRDGRLVRLLDQDQDPWGLPPLRQLPTQLLTQPLGGRGPGWRN
jgi:hypothetical protein